MKCPRSGGSFRSISSLRLFRLQPFSARLGEFQSPTDTSTDTISSPNRAHFTWLRVAVSERPSRLSLATLSVGDSLLGGRASGAGANTPPKVVLDRAVRRRRPCSACAAGP